MERAQTEEHKKGNLVWVGPCSDWEGMDFPGLDSETGVDAKLRNERSVDPDDYTEDFESAGH